MSNYKNNNRSAWNSSSNPSKNIDENGKQSSLEEYYVRIIGTRLPISSHVSPTGQNIVFPKTYRFSKKRPDHNWKSCGQHDYSYYQPQPYIQNHSQHYRYHRRIQQASSKQYYDR